MLIKNEERDEKGRVILTIFKPIEQEISLIKSQISELSQAKNDLAKLIQYAKKQGWI